MPVNKGRTPVKTTKTSLEIIETVREQDGATLTEIAELLDMPDSTVYDHLQTLENTQFLIHEDSQYRIGSRFLELGGHSRSKMKIYQESEPEIQKLANDTGEHANLMVEEQGHGVLLYRAKGQNSVNLDTYAGKRLPMQTTSLGKAILANLPREQIHDILDERGFPKYTERSITSREEMLEELATIRERGYAIDDEERVEGVRCVAAPIMDDTEVLGSISVTAPVSRMRGERFKTQIPEQVKSTANLIELNLKYA